MHLDELLCEAERCSDQRLRSYELASIGVSWCMYTVLGDANRSQYSEDKNDPSGQVREVRYCCINVSNHDATHQYNGPPWEPGIVA